MIRFASLAIVALSFGCGGVNVVHCGLEGESCCDGTSCNASLSCVSSVCQSTSGGTSGALSPVGTWSETVSGAFVTDVSYASDGSVTYSNGGSGTWTMSGSMLVVHGFAAGGGTFTDTLTMSADGNTLTGQNSGGLPIVESRLGSVSTSPVGSWSEYVGGSFVTDVAYASNGTVSYSNGGSGTWSMSGSTVVVHGAAAGGGTFTDTLTMSSDGSQLTGQNSGGLSIIETRL
jgi:hypothetical protein